MSIFPFIENTQTPSKQLPLMREIARNPDTGQTVWRGGQPVVVSGLEAVKSWAVAALLTVRRSSPANSRTYGSDLQELLGDPFTPDIGKSILPGVLRSALLQCPYITGVEVSEAEIFASVLSCTIQIKTIYGEATVYVNDGKNI